MMSLEIFGKYLMGYYMGDKTPFTIHRDDGYFEEHHENRVFSDYNKWPECERRALEHVKGRVLDIGCGAGRHSLWLQGKGFKVVAIDVSPSAVEVTKLRGVKDCRVTDARNLSFLSNSFDTVLMMGNNFGVAGDVEGTKRLLEKIYKITSEDATIIATSKDPAATDNPAHMKYHEFNRKRGRPIGQVTMRFGYKGEVGDWFDLLQVSPGEMREICKPAGWAVEEIFPKEEDGMYAAILRKA